MLKIIVASKNPVKINATRMGFNKMFPNSKFKVSSTSVSSGVSDQPLSDKETFRGANNRADNASIAVPDADYWVGIEGGLEKMGNEFRATAWVYIKSKKGRVGKGRTGSFFLPNKVVKLIKEGKELGEADDIVFGRNNSKQKNGAVGLLTKNIIVRTTYYEPAVILALIPFKNPKLY